MARLLQVFGFLSVLFRGATLTFQSLAVGGIVFLILVVRRAEEDSAALLEACLRWIRRSALALAIMEISYVLANSIILRQSADMPLCDFLRSDGRHQSCSLRSSLVSRCAQFSARAPRTGQLHSRQPEALWRS